MNEDGCGSACVSLNKDYVSESILAKIHLGETGKHNSYDLNHLTPGVQYHAIGPWYCIKFISFSIRNHNTAHTLLLFLEAADNDDDDVEAQFNNTARRCTESFAIHMDLLNDIPSFIHCFVRCIITIIQFRCFYNIPVKEI